MPNLAKILNKPKGLSRASWRKALEARVGPAGERIWEALADAVEGRAWRPVFRDENGLEVIGQPITPTWADRIAAARYLADRLYGKPVDQEAAARLTEDQREQEAARALSDADLKDRLRRVLEPGPETDAQIVENPKG